MTVAEDKLNNAYAQRNALAVAFVKMALLQGWPTGRGIDGREENDMEWRHVVYVDLPNGDQVSWHMAPEQVYLLDGLPCYRGEWNGKWTATDVDWVKLLDCAVDPAEPLYELAERCLSGFAHKRWLIEANKLEMDTAIAPEIKEAILRGYVASWRKDLTPQKTPVLSVGQGAKNETEV